MQLPTGQPNHIGKKYSPRILLSQGLAPRTP
jgi:hypothetical protein